MTSPLDYVARGWRVFPCHTIERGRCSCAQGVNCSSPGKHPRTANGVKDATDNADVIATWMHRFPESNWAVACGRVSGIVVLDIDPRKDGFTSIDELETNRAEGPLPATLTSLTGGAGRHLFYIYPEAEQLGNRTNWLPGVDVKSEGGYVILPEATHISGGVYSWSNWGHPIAPMPSDILQALRGSGLGASTGELPTSDEILRGVPEGSRDDTLFRWACRLRRQMGDDAKDAVYLLCMNAAASCDPPFPEVQVRKCVESAWRQDHSDDQIDWLQAQTGGEAHNLTDLGNSRRYVDHFGDRVRHVPGWGWVSWSDTRWIPGADAYAMQLAFEVPNIIMDEARAIEDQDVQRRYFNWSRQSEAAARLNAMVTLSSAHPPLRSAVEDFDAADHMLNCRNGIVDLRTGEMRLLDQSDLVTKNTGVIYDPDAQLKEWDAFLHEACEGDLEIIEYLQRAAGYSLTGSNAEEAFFIISGPPASGKSTFLDALHAALGQYATSTQSETFMYRRNQSTPHNELARFAGMRLVSVSEVRESDSFDEALIKQFTGGDRVTARYLYRDAFEYRPQLKLWIGTNHDPDARDQAMWRRIKKVAFRNAIPYERRDPGLKTMLRDPEIGGAAVLSWAVQGAVKWYDSGLQQPVSVTEQVRAYHQDQDRVSQFIDDCLTYTPGARTSLNDMWDTWRNWCQITSEFPGRQPGLKKVLEARGVTVGRDERGRVQFHDYRPKSMTITATGVAWA